MERQILVDLRDIAHDQKHILQFDEQIKELEVKEAKIRTDKRQIYFKKMDLHKSINDKINNLFARESKAVRKDDNA